MKKFCTTCFFSLSGLLMPLFGALVLENTSGWRATHAPNRVEIVSTPGALQGMVKFSAPKWRGPQSQWPAFENELFPRDWSKFDRLAIPYYGDSDSGKHLFGVWITDIHRRLQKGVYFEYRLDHPQAKMLVFNIRKAFQKRGLDAKNIVILHCFTENPPTDHRVYIGQPILLEPGEKVPELPRALKNYADAKKNGKLAQYYQAIKRRIGQINLTLLPPTLRQFIASRQKNLLSRLVNGKLDLLLLSSGLEIMEYQSLSALAQVALHSKSENLLVGYAPPTLKVVPQFPVFEPLPERLQLTAARNENESLQVVVMPIAREYRDVEVKFSDFKSPNGVLSPCSLQAMPVGFVETHFLPPNGSRYIGYWPDPLLNFMEQVTISPNQAQPFWIKAQIAAQQAPGSYHGFIKLLSAGQLLQKIPLTIQVRNFTLPHSSMLPLAVTFGPVVRKEQGKPEVGCHLWHRHRDLWQKMLNSYYLHFDHLYWSAPKADYYEIYRQEQQQNLNCYFNLGNFHIASDTAENCYGMQKYIDHIKVGYEQAKKLGLLKYAYIYGADEARKADFYRLQKAAKILKEHFPEVPIFTTATDESYGTNGQVSDIDWYCPLTSNYDIKTARKARQAGKKVWWYISNSTLPPYANNFVESTGLEFRLLMGAMAAKYKVDGFLYYYISFWNRFEPITQGPFTGMDARSYPRYNGDGNWCYAGPDYTPLATIRLENFRDGLEDYAYWKILQQKVKCVSHTPKNRAWLSRAQRALAIPHSVVSDLKKYTHNFSDLQAWRHAMAELIETAPAQ